jgi:hypothetical protein
MRLTDSTIKEYENYCYREREAMRIPKSKEDYDLERSEGNFRSDGTYVGIEWNERLGYPRILKPFIDKNGELDYPSLIIHYRVMSSLDLENLPRWKRFKIRKNLKIFQRYVNDYLGAMKSDKGFKVA